MVVQLSKNFVLSEFHCRDGTPVPAIFYANLNTLVFNLQILRHHVNKPIIVTSGWRSIEYNTLIGGSKKSQHLIAKGGDLKVPGMEPPTLYNIIDDLIKDEHMKPGGLGLYDTFVHYDVRGQNVRWIL